MGTNAAYNASVVLRELAPRPLSCTIVHAYASRNPILPGCQQWRSSIADVLGARKLSIGIQLLLFDRQTWSAETKRSPGAGRDRRAITNTILTNI